MARSLLHRAGMQPWQLLFLVIRSICCGSRQVNRDAIGCRRPRNASEAWWSARAASNWLIDPCPFWRVVTLELSYWLKLN